MTNDTGRARSEMSASEWRRDVNRRIRAAWLSGADEASRRLFGRGLTLEELRAIIARYPGDLEE